MTTDTESRFRNRNRHSRWSNMLLWIAWAGTGITALYGETLGMNGALAIHQVRADQLQARVHECLRISVDLSATYDNPFAGSQVALTAHIEPDTQTAAGSSQVPGFYYQPYRRRLQHSNHGDREVLEPDGPGGWQLRLSFPQPGTYRVRVALRDHSGEVSAPPFAVEILPADVAGMTRRHPADSRYLAADRGETVFLRGANVCWADARGTAAYDEWLPRYAAAGCNAFRLWLSPQWATFAMNTLDSGFDRIDLANAWRLDYVLELGERLGLQAMLCIDSFNILRTKEKLHGCMEESPYHVSQGGPVAAAGDYFSAPAMQRTYRDRLRYLVARYGCMTSVLAWEFWNEVDLVDNYDRAQVVGWHGEMAAYLRELDPWKHLVTTSTAHPGGEPQLDVLPEFDLVQTHHYQARDMALALPQTGKRKQALTRRPHLHGEFGISHSGSRTGELDPSGIHLHNGLYASVVQCQAGTPLSWWWDSYIHPQDLYPLYRALAAWIDGVDFAAQGMRPLAIAFANSGTDVPPLRGWGIAGHSQALAWFQDPRATWFTISQGRGPDAPVTGQEAVIRNLPPGHWTGAWWHTRRGVPSGNLDLRVPESGILHLALPSLERDLALRLTRQTP